MNRRKMAERRELSETEIAQISGGMKWDHNYVSKNVIDARGGYVSAWGVTLTFDLNGKVTSINSY